MLTSLFDQTNHISLNQTLERIYAVMRDGAAPVATEISREIILQAQNEFDKPERTEFKFTSQFLHELIEDLDSVCAIVEENLTRPIEEEYREHKAAEAVNERGLKSCQKHFPRHILMELKKCVDLDLENDRTISAISRAIKAIADRTPAFVTNVLDIESNFCSSLNDSLDMGNESLIHKEQESASEKFEEELQGLRDALDLVLKRVGSDRAVAEVSRSAGVEARSKLVELIDQWIENPTAGLLNTGTH